MIEELEKRCAARLAEVFPEPPVSLAAARRQLARLRKRPIRIVATDPGELDLPVGLWISRPTVDIVWVDGRTSSWHQRQMVGHELGHMIWNHTPTFGPSGVVDAFARGIAARVLQAPTPGPTGLLGRCCDPLAGADPVEDEAEIIGRLLVRPFTAGGRHEAVLSALIDGG